MGWTYRDADDGVFVWCFLRHLISFHIFDLAHIGNEMMSWCVLCRELVFSLNVHHSLLDGFDLKEGDQTLQLMTLFA